ncbi:gluconate 2-dehydrogenase subunit 3 family protein [Pedobacter sp. PAMC26386]|nr:gluconate 2-dehydrogenase subunit 3 family protein [Pedobacter sp. PAMC26386]
MDRRTTIKGLVVFVSVGFSSFSLYKWVAINSIADVNQLYRKKALLSELAEVIIPRTDTPGAKDAQVEDYIIDMIKFCTEPKTQHKFLNGLADLEVYVSENYNRDFIACSKSEKVEILKYFEAKSLYRMEIINKVNNRVFGMPFFILLKQLTVEGYCTSQLGATKGLAYDYIPGMYASCIPLTKNQKSWATK